MKDRLKIIKRIYSKPSKYWERRLQTRALEITKEALLKVKAYSEFVKKNNTFKKAKIKTFEDFRKLPVTEKDNYLRHFPWNSLCKKNSLARDGLVLTSTSGSTGAPFYFPRSEQIDIQSSVAHELFLKNIDLKKHENTLVMVCFGMGVWIGGLITYQAFKYCSLNGNPVTIVTPGVNRKEIYESLRNIAPKYDNIILCGYPPFMKDLVDDGPANGVNWKSFKLNIIFAAETFSETFRDYIALKTGIEDIYTKTMNIYGSADLGTMAQETPLSILIRRFALKNKSLYSKLFGQNSRLPTLAQFIPEYCIFESVNGKILCTGDNVMPLIRYQIGDNGGVKTYTEVAEIFMEFGIELKKEAKKLGFGHLVSELPFVYLFERSDFSTKLYGAIIYPEYIKHGLFAKPVSRFVTGKFSMHTVYDKNQNEILEVHVELKTQVSPSRILEKKICQTIIKALSEKSAEYSNNLQMMSSRVHPKVVLWPHEHELHFRTGIKQKWLKKV